MLALDRGSQSSRSLVLVLSGFQLLRGVPNENYYDPGPDG